MAGFAAAATAGGNLPVQPLSAQPVADTAWSAAAGPAVGEAGAAFSAVDTLGPRGSGADDVSAWSAGGYERASSVSSSATMRSMRDRLRFLARSGTTTANDVELALEETEVCGSQLCRSLESDARPACPTPGLRERVRA